MAGAHAEGAHECGALGRVLCGWSAHRQRVGGQAREDLERRNRSRGEKLCGIAMWVVMWRGCLAEVSHGLLLDAVSFRLVGSIMGRGRID